MLKDSNHTHQLELLTFVDSFHYALGHIDPVLHLEPYQGAGIEDFRVFLNLIDGTGLSAQWTPEYNIDCLRLGNSEEP